MDMKPLIGISICAVVLLVLGSLSNVVGYQTVQTSQQNVIKERINQKELLFQTILDISNNREIQPIILKYQKIRGVFPESKSLVLTKNQLGQMYIIGLLLSKTVSKSRMQSMVQQYQLINPEMQKEISAVIEKNTALNSEMTQLLNSDCDCENKESPDWNYPIICNVLYFLALPAIIINVLSDILEDNPILKCIVQILGMPFDIIWIIALLMYLKLDCWTFIP